ncbi:MAG: hypothetical protein J5I50_03455 [Chitinophagaceae bacterium]|nr:hypothetical protein [Chitinophagaceae bacterium]
MNQKALLEKKNAKVGADIGHEEGHKMVTAFREAYPDAVPGHFIGRNILVEILNQPGCVGITFRKGLNDAGEEHLVYTGIDASGNDILTYTVVTHQGELESKEGIVADKTVWDWDILFPPDPPKKPKKKE